MQEETSIQSLESEYEKIWYEVYDLGVSCFDSSLFRKPKYYVVIDMIKVRVPKQGTGTKAMELFCKFADKYGLTIYLMPDDLFGTPLNVLIKFYEKFGFRKNHSTKIPLQYKHYHQRLPIKDNE